MLAVLVAGAFVDIMDVDAAQYAAISLEMLRTGSFLEIRYGTLEYLDKPPFLFWVSAFSMHLFGVTTWAYKLPSILFSILAIFSTYKLGERLYDAHVGRTASLILGTSLAMIMTNSDIKTDTILASSVIFSIWMLVAFLETQRWSYLIGGAVGIGISLLTKGPIGIMMPALAIGGHLLLTKQYGRLFNWRWSVALIIITLMLIPMCVGLYRQFGADGLRFYFWTQSFGRITGGNVWENDTTLFFFGHVFIWSFLPWSLLAVVGIAKRLLQLRSDLKNGSSEFYTISGIVLVGMALSLSKFKLPHYIFVVFPLVAIVTANYVHVLRRYVNWAWIQFTASCTAIILLVFVLLYCFPEKGYPVSGILLIGLVGVIMAFFMLYRHEQIVMPSVIAFIAIGLGLNLHLYPALLSYQANSEAGKWVTEHQIGSDRLIRYATGGYAFNFYANGAVPWTNDISETGKAVKKGMVVYADQDRYNELVKHKIVPDSILAFPNFSVQNLTLEFLDPRTRDEVVKKNYLLFY